MIEVMNDFWTQDLGRDEMQSLSGNTNMKVKINGYKGAKVHSGLDK